MSNRKGVLIESLENRQLKGQQSLARRLQQQDAKIAGAKADLFASFAVPLYGPSPIKSNSADVNIEVSPRSVAVSVETT